LTKVESKRGASAYFSSLVHDSVSGNALVAARHQSFITSHLIGGFLALAVFPVYLALIGQPSMLSAIAFSWLISPILIAVFLSRTGRLGFAHLISAISLAGLVTFAAGITGGITSFLIAWMVVVPLEAALSADRRVVFAAITIAALSLLGLAGVDALSMLPAPLSISQEPAILALLGSMSALVYAGGLAISVQGVYDRSEQEIRLGEQRYRLLAENATDMITRHNAKGQVLFASIASEQIMGEPAQVLMGSGMFERVHVADKPAYLNALSQCLELNKSISVEFRVKKGKETKDTADESDSGYSWAEMRCRPVSRDEGEHTEAGSLPHEIVAVTRDIAARKAQEEVILKARDVAESANQAKTQFLANMSHELRTPLNAIIGFSEILHRELYGRIGEDRYREYAQLIHESGEHLLSVVNEVLDMSKIEAGKFDIVTEHFEVEPLVKSCVEIMKHQGEKKSIDVRLAAEPQLPELVADKRECKQILLNLLANAIKFTDEGGFVEVSAKRFDEEIELAVSDNGIGIAEQDIPKLGNPFVQAESSYDRSYEGAGLGLSVVKGLVQLHGGSLEIESKLGEGTRVSIRLPVEGVEGNVDTPGENDNINEASAPVAIALSA
jgi:cell cycle sensor histidine kinase DivJ